MRISDWSSDVCSSDLHLRRPVANSQPAAPADVIRDRSVVAKGQLLVARRRADGLRSEGLVTGWPASISAARRVAPKSANATKNSPTPGFPAIPSTSHPLSPAVFPLAGPNPPQYLP